MRLIAFLGRTRSDGAPLAPLGAAAGAAAKLAGLMSARKSTHNEKTTGMSNRVKIVDMASPPRTAEPSPR